MRRDTRYGVCVAVYPSLPLTGENAMRRFLVTMQLLSLDRWCQAKWWIVASSAAEACINAEREALESGYDEAISSGAAIATDSRGLLVEVATG